MIRSVATVLLGTALVLGFAPEGRARIIFRPGSSGSVSTADMVADLRRARAIFFGELHDRLADHIAQQEVIQALREAGVELAIGMEMFRTDAQPALDAWVEGRLAEREFRGVWDRNWTPAYWDRYAGILQYARRERIPIVGLNIPREIVDQVAHGGFRSLAPDQLRALGVNSCDLPDRYEELLRRLLGPEARTGPAFTSFCEAQITWDAAMARTVADYLRSNPQRVMVVACGTFHAWRHGIPGRLERIMQVPTRVVLPTSDATFHHYEILLEDADYLWWEEE